MEVGFRIISSKEESAWNTLVAKASAHDMYHTCLYHCLQEEGESRLLVFGNNEGKFMALPLVFRNIPGTEWKDVTSVYGYAGWIRSDTNTSFPGVMKQLEDYLQQEKVVSAFSRLHPLIPGSDDFEKGKVLTLNTTTGIDLLLSPEKQFMAYSESVRRSIRKSTQAGMTVEWVREDAGLQHFISIYEKAMKRHHASSNYFFSQNYYEKLWRNESFQTFILAAKFHGEWAGAALFTICNGIMQYHLGGVAASCISYSPLKLILDEARKIANDKKCNFFHLGGGLGGRDDSLFVFKSRMTTLRYPFKVWQWIIKEEEYEWLSRNKKDSDFFPRYRISGE
jgi:hypothetical protein